jgi:hypothetical protein
MYTIEHNGVKLTVRTLEEAIQATKALGAPVSNSFPTVLDSMAKKPGSDFSKAVGADALKLLKLLRENPNGVGHEAVQRVWSVSHFKGLGPKTGAVERLLEDGFQFQPESVFTRDKTPNGRVWKGGKYLNEAIAALSDFISLI